MKKSDSFFLNTVEHTVIKHKLLRQNDSVLLAVSGGADSVSLLHGMLELRGKMGLCIGIAHLDHCLRGDESRRDSDFVKKLAEQFNLKFHHKTVNVKKFQKENGLSLEDAARKVRYDFLKTTAAQNGYKKIATGHTANDNAELVLMNLIRGAATSGLSGIPVKRDNIIRPLIALTREDVESYLTLKNAAYMTDSSNTDTVFLRNKIRLDLLPRIENGFNSNIVEGLNRTSRIIREDEEWIETITSHLYNDAIKKRTASSVSLAVDSLNRHPVAAKRRILRKAIEEIKGGLKKIALHHIEMILELTESAKQFLSVDLPDQIQVQRIQNELTFTRYDIKLRDLQPETIRFNYSINYLDQGKTVINIPEISKKLAFSVIKNNQLIDFKSEGAQTAWIDFDKLTFPLEIRNTLPEDSFIPLGMSGTQSLKKFFSSNSINREDKKKCPLLLSKNDIVWIGGLRLHDHYKIHENTKKILKVELLLD